MRLFSFLIIVGLFVNCQGGNEPDVVTGNVLEIPPDQLELDEIALAEQPQTVRDFFAINNDIIGDDFCYDYSSISQLILYGNDGSEEWKKFELSDNYLTAYHSECEVLLEFMTFDLDGEKKAFLSQMNGATQQFKYLSWNAKTERWVEINRYPQPALNDYFDFLENEESKIVRDYGSDFVYINPKTSSATFLFSEETMSLNMGEKQMLNLTEEPKYYYELETSETALTLTRVPLNSHPKQSYIVACSIADEPSALFKAKYDAIIIDLGAENIEHQLTTYGANKNKVFFSDDTLTIGALPINEDPFDSFWLFQSGKEPLMIFADQSMDEIVKSAKTYFDISE